MEGTMKIAKQRHGLQQKKAAQRQLNNNMTQSKKTLKAETDM